MSDQNKFDGFSPVELIEEVILGMVNAFELIERDKLFGIGSKDILYFIEKHEQRNLNSYFKDIVMREKSARLKRLPNEPFYTSFFGNQDINHPANKIKKMLKRALYLLDRLYSEEDANEDEEIKNYRDNVLLTISKFGEKVATNEDLDVLQNFIQKMEGIIKEQLSLYDEYCSIKYSR